MVTIIIKKRVLACRVKIGVKVINRSNVGIFLCLSYGYFKGRVQIQIRVLIIPGPLTEKRIDKKVTPYIR